MTPAAFTALMSTVTSRAAGRALDAGLERELKRAFPADGDLVRSIREACDAAITGGWMCSREAGGIRYGRVVKPCEATHGFSIDVVDMQDVVGPHHRHPHGEIDLIMPLDANATFDGCPKGWLVYPAGSAHHPTVSGGSALVLYLLPDGAIEFTKS